MGQMIFKLRLQWAITLKIDYEKMGLGLVFYLPIRLNWRRSIGGLDPNNLAANFYFDHRSMANEIPARLE